VPKRHEDATRGAPEPSPHRTAGGRSLEARAVMHKEKRFVDVVAIDPGTKNVVEMHQVGRQTKGGNPVSREVKALDDIQKSTGVRPTYHSYD
jgi:hypothetical protein